MASQLTILFIAAGAALSFSACRSLRPQDPHMGYVVQDHEKFRNDLRVCEEDASRLGFSESYGGGAPHNSQVRRCLQGRGWIGKSAASSAPQPTVQP